MSGRSALVKRPSRLDCRHLSHVAGRDSPELRRYFRRLAATPTLAPGWPAPCRRGCRPGRPPPGATAPSPPHPRYAGTPPSSHIIIPLSVLYLPLSSSGTPFQDRAVLQLRDRDQSVQQPGAVLTLHRPRFLADSRLEFSGHRLQHVLEGDQALDFAVLVDDEHHLRAGRPEVANNSMPVSVSGTNTQGCNSGRQIDHSAPEVCLSNCLASMTPSNSSSPPRQTGKRECSDSATRFRRFSSSGWSMSEYTMSPRGDHQRAHCAVVQAEDVAHHQAPAARSRRPRSPPPALRGSPLP